MRKIIAIVLLIVVLGLIGCAKKQAKEPDTTADTVDDVNVDDIEDDIAEIDTLEDDIDLSELDSLEEDLDAII